jgi:hypothetical protein
MKVVKFLIGSLVFLQSGCCERVQLQQLYLVSNPQRKCELTARKSGMTIECGFDVGASTISVNAINTEENWVHFDLRK